MLIAEYRKVAWKPRTVHGKLRHRENRAEWPDGVIPLDEWGLSSGGFPILKQMALKPEDFTIAELASMATGMIAGTVGNVQASTCIAMNQIFANVDCLEEVIAEANICVDTVQKGNLHHRVGKLLINEPPVAFLPRRALEKVQLGDKLIEAGDDVILWLTAASKIKQLQYKKEFYGLSFGAVDTRISDTSKVVATPHACLGKTVAHTLITAIVGAVLRLPSVAEVIDPVTGKPEGLERRWGFSCESYPLTYKRSLRIAQQPLNVIMRVKTPIDHHSTAVQNIIHVGAPRVVQVLKESAHVHFAWFQLMDQGRYLALHTVYDGNFEAYIQDFALKVDDLFDLLFEHVEGAPPLPVAENPGAFTNVIRAHNAPAVNGFFFSAAPTAEVSAIIAKANGS